MWLRRSRAATDGISHRHTRQSRRLVVARQLGLLLVGTVLAATLGNWLANALDVNSLANPFSVVEYWARLPAERAWGQVIGVEIDPDGQSVWVLDRCGPKGCMAPIGKTISPIQKFDRDGKLIISFGAGFTGSLVQLFTTAHCQLLPPQWVPTVLGTGGQIHYVLNGPGGGTTFKLSTTRGGSAITSISGGSGTQSVGLTGQTMLMWATDRLNLWNPFAVSYNKPIVLVSNTCDLYSHWNFHGVFAENPQPYRGIQR
jgi:hypothetical protein